MYISLKKARKLIDLHPNTLRRYADEGLIDSIRNPGGQRLYDIESYLRKNSNVETTIGYCRVSSQKQKEDLQRQIEYVKERYPRAEIVQDIGSGLNFKRPGLKTLLERLCQGDKLTIVVAYKDRLARFGFELIQFLVERNGGKILVLNSISHSPEEELTKDLLTILTVFSSRMHGFRKYRKQIKEDFNSPNNRTETNS